MTNKRFILIRDNSEFPGDDETCWYWDTTRPLDDVSQPYIAIQCYKDRNPHDFVYIEDLQLLFTDEAEYYCVCPNCIQTHFHRQWSGFTKAPNWRIESQKFLKKHQKEKGWCEFCDPVFGNGGWLR